MRNVSNLVAVPVLLASLLIPSGAGAHLAVTKTAPADNATVKTAPDRVQVWFSQPPSERVSRLELHGPGGEVALAAVTVDAKDRSIAAAIEGSLQPGTYEVRWRTAGNDGHVLRGTFRFSLAN